MITKLSVLGIIQLFVFELIVMELTKESHLQFIKSLDARISKMDYWQGDYLRMNGIYWALTALLLLRPDLDPISQEETFNELSPLSKADIKTFVASCQSPCGRSILSDLNMLCRGLWRKH